MSNLDQISDDVSPRDDQFGSALMAHDAGGSIIGTVGDVLKMVGDIAEASQEAKSETLESEAGTVDLLSPMGGQHSGMISNDQSSLNSEFGTGDQWQAAAGVLTTVAEDTISHQLENSLATIDVPIEEILQQLARLQTTEDNSEESLNHQNDVSVAIDKNIEKAADSYGEVLNSTAIFGQPASPSDKHSDTNSPTHYELATATDFSHHWPL